MATSRVIKNLGGLEDLSLGTGTEIQRRGDTNVTINKIDLMLKVSLRTGFDLSSVDTDKYRTIYFSGNTAIGDNGGGIFEFDADDTTTTASDRVLVAGVKRWKKVNLVNITDPSDSTASDVSGIVSDFNQLLTNMRNAGIL